MKPITFLLAVLLVGCSKEPLPVTGIQLKDPHGNVLNFPDYTLSSEPFCGDKKIYSIASGNLLISVVTDSLKVGSYEAGLTLWTVRTDNIHLVVTVINNSKLEGSFVGSYYSGIFKI